MKIIVGFSRPKKWKPFAWLIMKGYGIDYDHVYVKFHSTTYDRDVIYQASGLMVNFMSNKRFDNENLTVAEYEIEISDEANIAIIQFAMDNAGVPYGILEAVGLMWVRAMELINKHVSNPFADGGTTYVCCELVGYILQEHLGIKIGVLQDDITPKYLRSLMDAKFKEIHAQA